MLVELNEMVYIHDYNVEEIRVFDELDDNLRQRYYVKIFLNNNKPTITMFFDTKEEAISQARNMGKCINLSLLNNQKSI